MARASVDENVEVATDEEILAAEIELTDPNAGEMNV